MLHYVVLLGGGLAATAFAFSLTGIVGRQRAKSKHKADMRRLYQFNHILDDKPDR